MIVSAEHPRTAAIVEALLGVWPEHARFLEQSFASRDAPLMAATERHADAIVAIVGDGARLVSFCEDYRFLCDRLMEEEIFFRRHDRYRLQRFEDALTEVYSNGPFMARYMNFLLLSHVVWANHARAMAHFDDRYLRGLPPGADHLEIGPGHGLLLHLAAGAPNVASVTGWDISDTSIAQAAACLSALGDAGRVTLAKRDLFDTDDDADPRRFDSAALSEILEHLEDPVAALRATARRLRPGGRLWINVPVNSPAPDHIYLFRTPEEVVSVVEAAGFTPLETAFFPMTGQTLERARKRLLTISVVVTAELAV
jgi:2-polyprenyl-3-methyl-5-hydroxy-6-metoxy-1,4-benzoquinol methylase